MIATALNALAKAQPDHQPVAKTPLHGRYGQQQNVGDVEPIRPQAQRVKIPLFGHEVNGIALFRQVCRFHAVLERGKLDPVFVQQLFH